MARELHHDDVQQEDNLLIEAVSLLVQRQRETESWLASEMSHAEERAAAVERRYGDLEARLVGIEDQLERLVRELEPPRGDTASDQRLARLREQVEDLRSDTDGRPGPAPARPTPPTPVEPRLEPVQPRYEPVQPRLEPVQPRYEPVQPRYEPVQPRAPEPEAPRPATVEYVATPAPASASFLDAFGPRPEDRLGIVLIGIGLVVVLFALLTQLHV